VVVYRTRIDNTTFYLRLAESPDEDLTTDATILGRLRDLGVSVPRAGEHELNRTG
jgi:hypothetical protein